MIRFIEISTGCTPVTPPARQYTLVPPGCTPAGAVAKSLEAASRSSLSHRTSSWWSILTSLMILRLRVLINLCSWEYYQLFKTSLKSTNSIRSSGQVIWTRNSVRTSFTHQYHINIYRWLHHVYQGLYNRKSYFASKISRRSESRKMIFKNRKKISSHFRPVGHCCYILYLIWEESAKMTHPNLQQYTLQRKISQWGCDRMLVDVVEKKLTSSRECLTSKLSSRKRKVIPTALWNEKLEPF